MEADMATTRSSTEPGQHVLVIVIVVMILLVAAFIVRTATLRADAQRALAGSAGMPTTTRVGRALT